MYVRKPSFPRGQSGREVAQPLRLLDDPVAAQALGPPSDCGDHLADVVDVALGVDPPGERQPHQLVRRGGVRAAVGRGTTEHERADLDAAQAFSARYSAVRTRYRR